MPPRVSTGVETVMQCSNRSDTVELSVLA